MANAKYSESFVGQSLYCKSTVMRTHANIEAIQHFNCRFRQFPGCVSRLTIRLRSVSDFKATGVLQHRTKLNHISFHNCLLDRFARRLALVTLKMVSTNQIRQITSTFRGERNSPFLRDVTTMNKGTLRKMTCRAQKRCQSKNSHRTFTLRPKKRKDFGGGLSAYLWKRWFSIEFW